MEVCTAAEELKNGRYCQKGTEMDHIMRVEHVLDHLNEIRIGKESNAQLQLLHNLMADGMDRLKYAAVSRFAKRRVEIVRVWFFRVRRMQADKIARMHNISLSTVYRDIRVGVSELARWIEPAPLAQLTEECSEWLS